jgi:hypothetical protein
MAFPDGVQTVTLTAGAAGYRTLDGDAYQGTIRLTPSVSRVVSAEHGAIVLGIENITVGASGEFSQAVLATDADGFSPSGWTYRVDEEFTNAPGAAYNISLPASAGTVTLSALTRVAAVDGVEIGAETAGTAAAAVAAHSADTTNVHGIADTTLLETAAGAAAKVAAHSAVVTTVHGIADTAALETAAGAASKVSAHSAATDPHGDRAWADGKFAAQGTVTTLNGYVNDTITRVSAIEQGTAFLAGVNSAGPVLVSGDNLTVTDFAKGYRFRVDGSALDLEATGTDLIVSNWSGNGFNGTQRAYLRLSADAQNIQIAGKVEYVDALYGATRHVLDGAANTAGFFGAAAVGRQTVSGSWADGSAGESLAAALAALGLITDNTTA